MDAPDRDNGQTDVPSVR